MTATPVGTKAGALLWWATIAPAGIVPKAWTTHPPALLWSPTKAYKFTAGGASTGPDATGMNVKHGYGTIAWVQANPGKGGGYLSQSLYVQWNAGSGAVTAKPQTPDTGVVTPVGPLDGISGAIDSVPKFLAAITSRALWVRIGIASVGVALLIVALVIMLRKDAGAALKLLPV